MKNLVLALVLGLSAYQPSLLCGQDVAQPTAASVAEGFFQNPIGIGADPWIVKYRGGYIASLSRGGRGIFLAFSDRLTELGKPNAIWSPPTKGMCSAEFWAPELHRMDDRWYVYFAASDGNNANHRMWALQSQGEDPAGPYTLKGPLYTGDSPETGADNRWAIDGTILEVSGKRYFVWSGWESTNDVQYLYIAAMKDPLTLSKRTRLCANDDYLWERVDETLSGRGLHEGPAALQHDGHTFLVYSCSGSWQPTYKLGLLELKKDGDPLNPASWIKSPRPVLESTEKTFGVGHCSFVKSPNGAEDWIFYHAKMERSQGWRRAIYAQPFAWKTNGWPDFGTPAAPGAAIALPH